MNLEDKLKAFFAAQAAPARDLMFEAELAERVARRRAVAAVMASAPLTVAATAALWGLRPVVEPLAQDLSAALVPAGAVLSLTGITGVLAVWLSRRFAPGR